MSHVVSLGRVVTDRLHACLVRCDGTDAPGGGEGVLAGERIWLVLRGRFRFESGRVRRAGDPATALFTRDREPHRVRHEEGCGDLCVTVGGELATSIVEGGRPLAALSVRGYARLHALAQALAHAPSADPFAVEEQVVDVLAQCDAGGPRTSTMRERRTADAVAQQLALRFDRRLTLTELARPFGVSVFALCRAFRAVHGEPVHRMQQRLRLRHALAWVLGSELPLADVAAECGFASHAHLTTRFHREFGLTPSEARTEAGRRRLVATGAGSGAWRAPRRGSSASHPAG